METLCKQHEWHIIFMYVGLYFVDDNDGDSYE